MEGDALYDKLAGYYDLLYSKKDYKKEVEQLKAIINRVKRNKGDRLLDLGCGAGGHLKYLIGGFSCTGLDLNESMLEVARKKVKDARFIKGDLADFKLDDGFDVMISLFGTMGYLRTLDRLEAAFGNVYEHLNPGGVFIFEPWFDPDSFTVGIPFLHVYDGDGIKIARVTSSEVEGNISRIRMHYIVGRTGCEVEYHSDVHELGLFEKDETLGLLEAAGFTAEYDAEGIGGHSGIFIALKN